MREIKFRAWNAHENKMHTPFLWINESNLPAFVHVSTPTHELMQFTGLKDVNGVCIYEGDIVNFAGGDIRIVKCERGCFWCENDEKSKDPLWKLTHYCDEYMVIGNIHQHPELLEK